MQMDHQKPSSSSSSSTAKSSKKKILKYLPRATSSVTFQNPPIYSPVKDKRSSEKTHKSHLGIGFSGPMVSMIPADTRRKIKNDSDYTIVYEPTSPRVSCMGQVKCKYQKEKKIHRKKPTAGPGKNPPAVVKKDSRITSFTVERTHSVDYDHEEGLKKEIKSKKKLGFKKIFGGGGATAGDSGGGGGRKSGDGGDKGLSKVPLYLDKAPSLSSMKRFSSGRGKFSDIDWTKEGSAMDSGDRRYFSDEESDDEDIIVPSSAPVVMRNELGFDDKFIRVGRINVEPKKEINLWKRRTMPQPKPLQLHGGN